MDPEQDPFTIFQHQVDEKIDDLGKPHKKVHLDPMAQLQSAIIANKFSKDKEVQQ